MTKQTGLSRPELLTMFPGAVINEDTVLMPTKPLKCRVAALDAIVVRRLGAGETDLTNASCMKNSGRPQWPSQDTLTSP
jgi:hypothetical protein